MPYAPLSHERRVREWTNARMRCPTRPGSTARGYGATWQKLRRMFLRRNPVCDECWRVATEVHHRLAKRDGGADDFENLQALCKQCHSRKTGRGE